MLLLCLVLLLSCYFFEFILFFFFLLLVVVIVVVVVVVLVLVLVLVVVVVVVGCWLMVGNLPGCLVCCKECSTDCARWDNLSTKRWEVLTFCSKELWSSLYIPMLSSDPLESSKRSVVPRKSANMIQLYSIEPVTSS